MSGIMSIVVERNLERMGRIRLIGYKPFIYYDLHSIWTVSATPRVGRNARTNELPLNTAGAIIEKTNWLAGSRIPGRVANRSVMTGSPRPDEKTNSFCCPQMATSGHLASHFPISKKRTVGIPIRPLSQDGSYRPLSIPRQETLSDPRSE